MSKTKIKDWPLGERPRERLLTDGPSALSDAHLLAVILRTGGGDKDVIGLAMHLIETFGGLREIDRASIPSLRAIGGIGTSKAAQLKAAFELGKRMMRETSEQNPLFPSSGDVYAYMAPYFKNLKTEHFVALLLDTKNRLIRQVRVSEGTLSNSPIHPRECYREAIRESAASVIFVHNHPSGDPEPSSDDIAVTGRLRTAGDVVGIRLLDHVVVGEGRYVSLKERGIL